MAPKPPGNAEPGAATYSTLNVIVTLAAFISGASCVLEYRSEPVKVALDVRKVLWERCADGLFKGSVPIKV